MPSSLRFALSALLALLLAGAAWRANALAARGAVAAFVIGWLALLAGWEWAVLLLLFFLSGSALSRIPSPAAAGVDAIVEKGATRDATQVLANGGIFALVALLSLVSPSAMLSAAAAGALAAATADTWATEIGTRYGGTPRHLLTWRPVPRGTSGGVTLQGLLGSLAGALVLGAAASALGIASLAVVALAGFAGALFDSVLGATLQERRYCNTCESATERRVHSCGTETRPNGGIRWLNNDGVNFLATLVGAVVSVLMMNG